MIECIVKPVKTAINGFQDQLSLNAGQKYCSMQYASILQYFRPSLSYHLSLRSLLCLHVFLSGRFTHVLLYIVTMRVINTPFGVNVHLPSY